jgi:hypothetical protein
MPIGDEEELPIDIRNALKAATSESYERAFDWGISTVGRIQQKLALTSVMLTLQANGTVTISIVNPSGSNKVPYATVDHNGDLHKVGSG